MPITIEQLTKEAPELLAQIQKQAADQARSEGIAAERARVSEILAADGDPEVTRKAIADGTEAAACFKLFFESEKSKRAAGLEAMKAAATPPQGSEEPAVEKKNTVPADQQLAQKAREIAREKGIGIEEAQRLAFRQNPELAKAWTPAKM